MRSLFQLAIVAALLCHFAAPSQAGNAYVLKGLKRSQHSKNARLYRQRRHQAPAREALALWLVNPKSRAKRADHVFVLAPKDSGALAKIADALVAARNAPAKLDAILGGLKKQGLLVRHSNRVTTKPLAKAAWNEGLEEVIARTPAALAFHDVSVGPFAWEALLKRR